MKRNLMDRFFRWFVNLDRYYQGLILGTMLGFFIGAFISLTR